MTYITRNDLLLYDNREIYQAPGPIQQCIVDEFNNNSYILYDPRKYMPEGDYPLQFPPEINDQDVLKIINSNLVCISSTGENIWSIEKTHNRALRFITIYNHLGDLWAKRMDNDEFKVDRTTGKILEQHLGI